MKPAPSIPPPSPPTPMPLPPPPQGSPPDPDVLEAIRPRAGRGLRRFLGWGLLAVAVLVAGGLVVGLRGEEVRYETEVTRTDDLVRRVTAVGHLEPLNSVEIGSDLSGRVVEVLVQVNDPVKAGDVLVRLDPSTYENSVSQGRAQVAAAAASLHQAEVTLRQRALDLERATALLRQDAGTAVTVETAQLSWEAAEAGRDAAKAQLTLQRAALARAEDQLADTTIASPIDGVVTQRLVDPGQTVVSAMSATALLQIASDLTALKAVVDVDEADVGRVAIGQTAVFTVSAWPDRTFTAEVATLDLAPNPQESVVVYPAELVVQNDDLHLRPGMTATAEIEVERLRQQLLLPAAALRFSPEGEDADSAAPSQVWALKDGEPRAIPVEVLATEGAWIAIVPHPDLAAGTPILVGSP